MPKLNATHLPQRIADRLEELRSGKEVAARDLKAVLTEKQVAEMNAAWACQQKHRLTKRARNKQEEIELGWKSKREIYIEALEAAYIDAVGQADEEIKHLLRVSEVRQSKIFLDSYFLALDAEKPSSVALTQANNDLVRAGLNRLHGQGVRRQSRRDKDVFRMEEEMLRKIKSEMTPEELEQLDLLEEYEKSMNNRINLLKK